MPLIRLPWRWGSFNLTLRGSGLSFPAPWTWRIGGLSGTGIVFCPPFMHGLFSLGFFLMTFMQRGANCELPLFNGLSAPASLSWSVSYAVVLEIIRLTWWVVWTPQGPQLALPVYFKINMVQVFPTHLSFAQREEALEPRHLTETQSGCFAKLVT